MKKIIGIGNALTDMLINLDNDSRLTEMNLARGSMSLVDSELQRQISASVATLPTTMSPGGSAANTIRALASMGCQSMGYIGEVGQDSTGDFFEQALINLGIQPHIFRGTERSGKCMSLISADGERTMLTHLGAALQLAPEMIYPSLLDGYDCLYIEGYLVQNHDLIRKVAQVAKERGLTVAIDLASFNVVEENRDFLRELVRDYVDIVFANEDEATAFTGEAIAINSLQAISEMCDLAVVKIGMKGALIKQGSEVVHVGIMAAAKRVDTTGAGDFYAAGFLAGMCEGLSLRQCGTLGAIAAGKVIEVVGTTLSQEAWKDMRQLFNRVKIEKYLF
jgi:sugar/nucleoside kinase (ribokinase family)